MSQAFKKLHPQIKQALKRTSVSTRDGFNVQVTLYPAFPKNAKTALPYLNWYESTVLYSSIHLLSFCSRIMLGTSVRSIADHLLHLY